MTVEKWNVVERMDTWNVKQGKRCIARLQKKAGAHLEARRIASTPNLEQAVRLILGLEKHPAFADNFRAEADTGYSPEPETVQLSNRTRAQLLNALDTEGS
jgi:hypothetical protein